MYCSRVCLVGRDELGHIKNVVERVDCDDLIGYMTDEQIYESTMSLSEFAVRAIDDVKEVKQGAEIDMNDFVGFVMNDDYYAVVDLTKPLSLCVDRRD